MKKLRQTKTNQDKPKQTKKIHDILVKRTRKTKTNQELSITTYHL